MQEPKKLLAQVQEANGAVAEQKMMTVKVFKEGISGLAFSPDSQFIVTGSDKTISILNRHGALVRNIQLPYIIAHISPNCVGGIAVSHNSQFIVSANFEGRVQEWDSQSGELRQTYKGHGNCWVVAISPDDQSIVSGDHLSGGDIRIWHRASRQCRKLTGHTSPITAVAISPNNQYVVSGSHDNTVRIWDFTSGRLLKTLLGHEGFVRSVAISKDNQTIVSASGDRSIRLWDLRTGAHLQTLKDPSISAQGNIAITPDEQYIVFGHFNAVEIWNLKTGKRSSAFTQLPASVGGGVAVSSDGMQIVAGDNIGNLHIWNFPPELLAQKTADAAAKEAKSWVLSTFIEVLADPRKLSVALLQEMLTKVNHIDEFRFAYTLINIQLQQVPAHKDPLYGDIYKCLERLSETCLVGPSKDSKESSKQGANYIARYKGILKALRRAHIITEHEQDTLDNLAERNMVFSDHRFKELEGQVHVLKHQVELQQKNLELVAQDLNQLKKSLKAKADREFYFGIVKIGLLFMANGVIDLVAAHLNISNIAETGAALLKVDVKTLTKAAEQGKEAVKQLMDPATEAVVVKAGFNPDDLVDIWVESSVHLQVAPVSSSVSSSSSISSSLNHPTSVHVTPKPAVIDTGVIAAPTLSSSSSPSLSPKPDAKLPFNIAQSFASVSSPMMSSAAGGRRGSESDLYPIHSAINKNLDIETIGDLLDTGADINAKSAAGKTPVELAAEKGNLDMVKFLFSKGAAGNRLHLVQQAKQNQPASAARAGLSS
jgi:WD40 repeat protein